VPLSIRLLGRLRVERDGQRVCVPAGKTRELFAYLVLHPRRMHHREALAEVLFPEVDPARARRHLCDVVYRLRHALGAEWIAADGEYLSVAEEDLWVDVLEFNGTRDSKIAIGLYSGDLLEDLDATWLLPTRAQLRERAIILLERQCHDLIARNEPVAALDLAHRWIEVEPLSEQAHCASMRLYAQLGRFSHALEQYRYLSSILDDELGIQPSQSTRTLRDLIQSEWDSKTAATEQPLFVGRRRERAQLAQMANAALNGHGSLALLDGAAGVGKTRLLEVFAECATWRGFSVVRGRNGRLAGNAMSSPDSRPRTILLDDVHEAAGDTWEAVLDMAPSIPDQRVIVLLSGRSTLLRRNESAWHALRRLDDQAALAHYRLAGLNINECTCLAQAVGARCTAQDIERLQQHTGGNPQLFLDALRFAGRPDPRVNPASDRSDDCRVVQVELTRADVPLGRTLTAADRIVVNLTVDAGREDAVIRRAQGLLALRRHRLRRLVAEARLHGAAPTHAELAQLLGYSVRTIARDFVATGTTGTRRQP
jgi:DNA-binding SARP family transcriptional activator